MDTTEPGTATLTALRDAAEYIRNDEAYVGALKEIEAIEKARAADTEQLVRLRRAATTALEWMNIEVTQRTCIGHDQPSHCAACHMRDKAKAIANELRAALGVKEGEHSNEH